MNHHRTTREQPMRRRMLIGATLAMLSGSGGLALAAPAPQDLVEPLAYYKLYVLQEAEQLITHTRTFVEAVKKGDLATARQLYAPSRVFYERIEPIAELFSDLDTTIDSRADDHEKAEEDPEFVGFHRLEYALFKLNTTEGAGPVADRLLADVTELRTRITSLVFPPEKVVGGAAALIEEVAQSKISGEEDRYSHTDLSDFRANVDGAKKIVDLFRPLIQRADAALLAKVDGNFASVDTVLNRYQRPDGTFETYDKLTEADRNRLQGPITALAEDLSKLRGTLGLD